MLARYKLLITTLSSSSISHEHARIQHNVASVPSLLVLSYPVLWTAILLSSSILMRSSFFLPGCLQQNMEEDQSDKERVFQPVAGRIKVERVLQGNAAGWMSCWTSLKVSGMSFYRLCDLDTCVPGTVCACWSHQEVYSPVSFHDTLCRVKHSQYLHEERVGHQLWATSSFCQEKYLTILWKKLIWRRWWKEQLAIVFIGKHISETDSQCRQNIVSAWRNKCWALRGVR